MAKKVRGCLFVALMLGAASLEAQDPPLPRVSDLARFDLFNECAPMGFVVHVQGDTAEEIETEERVLTMAESRLRAARLYRLPTARSGPACHAGPLRRRLACREGYRASRVTI